MDSINVTTIEQLFCGLICRFLNVKVIFPDRRAKEFEVLKYYFCEYIVLFLTWFKVFLVEANLFQLLSCSQT